VALALEHQVGADGQDDEVRVGRRGSCSRHTARVVGGNVGHTSDGGRGWDVLREGVDGPVVAVEAGLAGVVQCGIVEKRVGADHDGVCTANWASR